MSESSPEYMTMQQVSDRFQVSMRTLRYWRSKGVGPPATLLEGSLRYAVDEVEAWKKRQKAASES